MGDVIYLKTRGKGRMTSILEVAQYFLSRDSMTHKKLQKLCYYAQAWYYTITGIPLVDSNFEAWVHGPVAPELYHVYKQWGWLSIPRISGGERAITDETEREILDAVYAVYGGLTGDQLETLTHSQEPWQAARVGYRSLDYCRNDIDLELMRKSCYDEIEKSKRG